jgi:hypothetical protein
MSYPSWGVPTNNNTLPLVILWLIVAGVVVPMVACGLARPIVSYDAESVVMTIESGYPTGQTTVQ